MLSAARSTREARYEQMCRQSTAKYNKLRCSTVGKCTKLMIFLGGLGDRRIKAAVERNR